MGKPRLGLLEAQRSYLRCGCCDPDLLDLVRRPLPEETRPAWWQTLDDEPNAVLELIESAFGDVTLGGGVSLREADQIDDYELPARDEHSKPPKGYDEDARWQNLTLAELERFSWGNFPFQDARGVRFHFAAFAAAFLRGHDLGAIDSLVFTLESGHQLAAVTTLCTPEQRHAIARFLAFLAVGNQYFSRNAAAALRNGWGLDLEAAHLEYVLR